MEAWLATTSPSMPSLEDPRLVAIGLGLLTLLVFKTTEPRQPRVWLLLLIGGPAALTISVNYAFSSVTTAVLSVFSIYFATLLTSLALYRLSPFHPLAPYPGPILHKLSNFQMVRVALTGKRNLYITELHKKYGSHVRVGAYLRMNASSSRIKSARSKCPFCCPCRRHCCNPWDQARNAQGGE